MEIDIPDLDDVLFVEDCGWCNAQGKRPDSPKKIPGTNKWAMPELITCTSCGGVGNKLTKVGERLIKFLDSLGVPLKKDGWKKFS